MLWDADFYNVHLHAAFVATVCISHFPDAFSFLGVDTWSTLYPVSLIPCVFQPVTYTLNWVLCPCLMTSTAGLLNFFWCILELAEIWTHIMITFAVVENGECGEGIELYIYFLIVVFYQTKVFFLYCPCKTCEHSKIHLFMFPWTPELGEQKLNPQTQHLSWAPNSAYLLHWPWSSIHESCIQKMIYPTLL